MTTSKPYTIDKQVVWAAYQQVKRNRGAAGVDGVSIAAFEAKLEDNLYKLWNRMSSGSYFPPPVRQVTIPKGDGRVRTLGIPTVTDRIAQTVVVKCLEPVVEPKFHRDSYGYRPGRSALQAIGVCRERCWQEDWVIDLDIQTFFDTLPHDLLLKAVRQQTDLAWIPLYLERWLQAPRQEADGTLVARMQGSPQGAAVSPLLANLYLHYAFDRWMHQHAPHIRFERYCDDIVVHCRSSHQAAELLAQITVRLVDCGLVVNQEKTRIVYCQDDRRGGRHDHTQFDFLGYTFRARPCKDRRSGTSFLGFTPAISDQAQRRISREIRGWHLHRWSSRSLNDLAERINPVVRGWHTYYGRYYPSAMSPLLARLNEYLVHWAQRKYARLRTHPERAWQFLAGVATREPRLFVHWAVGQQPRAG